MSSTRRFPWALGAVLGATLLVYLRSLGGELVYDDLELIARNPLLGDLANVPRMFTQGYWDFLGEPEGARSGYWRPLSATVLALARALGGDRPASFHAASLCVHLGASSAAYALALRVAGDRTAAFFAALVFALHPVHVEGVAWISALNDPLCGLFSLLSLSAFLGWRARGSRGLPLASAAFLGIALLAKELAVAVVPMALVLDLCRARGAGERAGLFGGLAAPARAYGTLGGALAAYYLARVLVFRSPTAGLDHVTTYFGVGAARLALLRVEILGGALKLLAWPVELNLFRPFHPTLPLTSPAVLGAALALVVFALLAVWDGRAGRRRELAALWLIPAALLPVLVRVASIGRFPLSERFLYLPAFGFALYATLCARRLLPRGAAHAALLLVGALFAFRTYAQSVVWQAEEPLFRSALAADPRSVYARWGLGRVLLNRYRRTKDPAALAEAFDTYHEAQALVEEVLGDPDSDLFVSSADVLQINLGLGWCLVYEAQADPYHDFDTPAALFEQLLERIYEIRGDADAARRRGLQVLVEPLEVELVHVALGVAHMLAGRADQAEEAFRRALAENEAYPEAHSNYGRLLAARGDFERARRHLERALELRPGGYEERLMLAQALFELGWYDRADELARELYASAPSEPEALLVLAGVAARRSELGRALAWADEALEADPTHGHAWYLRAGVLVKLGERDEALRSFRRAAELRPESFEVQYDFGAYLLASGVVEAALPHLVRAYGLCRDETLYLRLRETLLGLALAPEHAVALGAVDRARGQFESAAAWLERALALEPANGEALLQEGRLLRDRGDPAAAADALAAACAALPSAFVPRFELGIVLNELGRHAEALARLREALAIGPPSAWTPEEAASTVTEIEKLVRALQSEVGTAEGAATGGSPK